MNNPIVKIETPFGLKRALAEMAKSNRIAEIQNKAQKLRLAQAAVDKFESVDVLEEVVEMENGEIMVLFSLRGDESSDGVAVLKEHLDSGMVTRKQACDELLGLKCSN